MSGTSSQLPDVTQPMTVVPRLVSTNAQTLWFALQSKPWASLAVVPGGAGETALEVANTLYDAGALVCGGPMRLLDARDITLATSASFILNMTSLVAAPGERRSGGMQRVVVVLSSVLDQPTGVPVTLAVDAVVLTITLGQTRLDAVRRTLATVGAGRVLGWIQVDG